MEYTNNYISSSIMGFVIGDALGVPAEFKDRSYFKANPIVDMIGFGTHNQPEGTWSDDSSMMIATMDSIVENNNEINYFDIMNKFVEWASQAKYTGTGVFFDIGISTRNALVKYTHGFDPTKCGGVGVSDNGNGSLMRILPIVLFSIENSLSFEDEMNLINNCSSLTHGHEISRLGCKIYSDFIKELITTNDKKEALEKIKFIDYSKYYSEESINYYKRILNGTISDLPESHIKSSGFVVDTLEASIWCLMNFNNYKETTLGAVNLGDDTDTVAAVTGSLAGLYYGIDSIPKEWIDKIKNKAYLEDLIVKFQNVLGKKNSLGEIN